MTIYAQQYRPTVAIVDSVALLSLFNRSLCYCNVVVCGLFAACNPVKVWENHYHSLDTVTYFGI